MTDVTLMIVDDSNTDRYILRRLLTKTGANVDVIEYSDARTALDWL